MCGAHVCACALKIFVVHCRVVVYQHGALHHLVMPRVCPSSLRTPSRLPVPHTLRVHALSLTRNPSVSCCLGYNQCNAKTALPLPLPPVFSTSVHLLCLQLQREKTLRRNPEDGCRLPTRGAVLVGYFGSPQGRRVGRYVRRSLC